MFREVYPLLQQIDPSLTEAAWSSIFNYKWEREQDYCGYCLFEGKEIVGFLGLIFSKRMVDDTIECFCNMTSWIVKEQYRGHSLSLLLPALRLKDHTITDLSPAKNVIRILERFGFKELDSRVKILLPTGIFGRDNSTGNCHISLDMNQIMGILNKKETRILKDHFNYPYISHLLAYNKNSYCYVIFTIVRNPILSYCYIHHISNVKQFSIYSRMIRSKITKAGKTRFVLVDSRLVRGIKLPFSFDLPIRFPKLYRSSSLRPEQIDNLYSELPLLNLNIIPSNLRELWQDL